jgi:glyoxylase-like metal-dependent hydrolase (beta-lactamase superfamily II)
MKQLAEDVYQLKGWPKNAINVYLLGDVLIDAATRQAEGRIIRQINGRPVSAHALTHVHPDHQGSSHAICEKLGIPLWCGQADVPAMEIPGSVIAGNAPRIVASLQERFWVGPPHPVARALSEEDEVAGFSVLETPGHTRPCVLLARVRSGADRRRCANEHEPDDRDPRPARAARVRHPRPSAQP